MIFDRIRDLTYRTAGTLGRRNLDAGLDQEVRDHLDRLEDRFRAEGLSPDEARRRARLEFGNVARLRESHRAERSLVGLETLARDFAYAFRGLASHPGFALTAILSIALAIGANSAIFSYADGLLLRPLPVPDPSSVVSLRPTSPGLASDMLVGGDSLSWADFADYGSRMTSFAGLAAYSDIGVGFSTSANDPTRRISGFLVSGNFFRVLGIEPAIGRGFLPEEDTVPGRDAVVVLADGLWRSEFGGDPEVLGRIVRVDGIEFTVVGVADKAFTSLDPFVQPDFFIPAMEGPAISRAAGEPGVAGRMLSDRDLRMFQVKGRLRPGVSRRDAANEAALVARSLAAAFPDTNRGWGATVSSEVQLRLIRYPLIGLLVSAVFAVVIVNLLVACANVANLMLTRGRARGREIATRLALGASRARVVRLLVSESLLIALASGALALLVADFAVSVFSTIQLDPDVRMSFQMDSRVVAFTLLVSISSALLFGLVPALGATRTDLVSSIKVGESGPTRRRLWGRSTLAIVQIAGSMMLLWGAAGFRMLFDDALTRYPGFERDHRITMRFDPGMAGYDDTRIRRFWNDLTDRAAALPGIRSATLTSNVPLTWFNLGSESVVPEGYQLPADRDAIDVLAHVVDDHYFETFGVPILEGRGFTATDAEDTPRVAVVNEAFAAAYLGPNPVGSRLRLDDAEGPMVDIVGLAMTTRNLSVIEPPVELIYLPLSQNPRSRMVLIAETDGDPAAMAGPLQEMVRNQDPDVAVDRVQTMDEVFEGNSVSMLRVVSATYDAAALMGLALALVGLYAVLSYQVARQTAEIGIRMALGARSAQIMKAILGRAAAMACAGIVIGTALSLVAGQAVATALDVTEADLGPLLIVALTMVSTTLLASAIPARRAARIDPQRALRQE